MTTGQVGVKGEAPKMYPIDSKQQKDQMYGWVLAGGT